MYSKVGNEIIRALAGLRENINEGIIQVVCFPPINF